MDVCDNFSDNPKMMTNIASNFDFNSVLIYCGLCLLFEFICLDFFSLFHTFLNSIYMVGLH